MRPLRTRARRNARMPARGRMLRDAYLPDELRIARRDTCLLASYLIRYLPRAIACWTIHYVI